MYSNKSSYYAIMVCQTNHSGKFSLCSQPVRLHTVPHGFHPRKTSCSVFADRPYPKPPLSALQTAQTDNTATQTKRKRQKNMKKQEKVSKHSFPRLFLAKNKDFPVWPGCVPPTTGIRKCWGKWNLPSYQPCGRLIQDKSFFPIKAKYWLILRFICTSSVKNATDFYYRPQVYKIFTTR